MSKLTFAFRQLLKNLGFTAAAVLMHGLGIGANSASSATHLPRQAQLLPNYKSQNAKAKLV